MKKIDEVIKKIIVIVYKVCIKMNNDGPETTSKLSLGATLYMDFIFIAILIMEAELLPIRSMSDLSIVILTLGFLAGMQLFIDRRYFKDKILLKFYKRESLDHPDLKTIEVVIFFTYILHPYMLMLSMFAIIYY